MSRPLAKDAVTDVGRGKRDLGRSWDKTWKGGVINVSLDALSHQPLKIAGSVSVAAHVSVLVIALIVLMGRPGVAGALIYYLLSPFSVSETPSVALMSGQCGGN